jgi:hypothetical protein
MVRPLDYNTGLTLPEAEERYIEVLNAFNEIKAHYSGFFRRFIRNISKEDEKTLTDCVGVLLPLSLEHSVQSEVTQAQSIEGTLPSKIAQLSMQIMMYAAKFRNTEPTVLK